MDVTRLAEDSAMWEKVVRKLRGRLMPPAGRPPPDAETSAALTSWLETELDKGATAHPDPGHTETFPRLNRSEYQNAIRDLLALDIDVSAHVPAMMRRSGSTTSLHGGHTADPNICKECFTSRGLKVARMMAIERKFESDEALISTLKTPSRLLTKSGDMRMLPS